MTFLDLPPEIMDLIATFLLHIDLLATPIQVADETPVISTWFDSNNATFPPLFPGDDATLPTSTSGPLPAYSNISSLSSTCRQIRSNLFTSRESRGIVVRYDGVSHERSDRISPFLMASVKKLRLISQTDSPPHTKPNKRLPGIGDILSPYTALNELEISWNLLPCTDLRIQAMEAAALALPAIKYDLRYSRACVLALLETLRIRLGSPKSGFIDPLRADTLARQFDLILQQFDMPFLRHLEVSQCFVGMLDMVKRQWVQLLKSIPVGAGDWPSLQSVKVCVDVPYRFYIDAEAEAGIAIWEPLLKAIITHFSRTKNPSPRITIILQFSFCTHLTPDPFTSTGTGTADPGAAETPHYTPREQIAPSRKTMQAFINELPITGPARGAARVAFCLQVRGACAPDHTDYKILVRATYTPPIDDENVHTLAGAASGAVGTTTTTTTTTTRTTETPALEFETYQDNIDRLHAATVRPRTDGEAASAGPGGAVPRLGVGLGLGGGMGLGAGAGAARLGGIIIRAVDAFRRRAAGGMVFGAAGGGGGGGGVFMM